MHHPFEPDKSLQLKDFKQEMMLTKVMENGQILKELSGLVKIAEYCLEQVRRLPDEFKRFDYPHIYKVGLSGKMLEERNRLKNQYKK